MLNLAKYQSFLDLQAPRHFAADTGSSCLMNGSRHALCDLKHTDSCVIRAANDACVEVLELGWLDLLFPSDGEAIASLFTGSSLSEV